jgi:hypothetical protein
MSDEDADPRRQEAGQEAGSQEAGRTHRFWDALTELHCAIILRAMGNPHGFLFIIRAGIFKKFLLVGLIQYF